MVDALRATGRTRSRLRPTPLGASPAGARHCRRAAAPTPSTARAPATPLWRCIGDHAGDAVDRASAATRRGGRVRPSLGAVDRRRSALGVVRRRRRRLLRHADDRRRPGRTTRRSSPWLRRLAGAVDASALSGGTPLATMATRPARSTSRPRTDGRARPGCQRRPSSTPTTLSRRCGSRRCWRCPTGIGGPRRPGRRARHRAARRRRLGRAGDGRPSRCPSATTMLALRDALAGADMMTTDVAAMSRWRSSPSPRSCGRRVQRRRRRRRRRRSDGDDDRGDGRRPGDCIVVDMAVSSEKIALLTELADEFNDGERRGRRPLRVRAAAQRGVGQRRHADRRGLARTRRPTASRR